MCIFCFLDKQYQKKLREEAQSMSNRHEQCLDLYKKIYLKEFSNSLKKDVCINHNKLCSLKEKVEKLDLKKLGEVFEVFKNSYLSWINNNSSDAKKMICNFFEDNNLFKEENLENILMFRARKSDEKLKTTDMFHIPFTKRNLIKNQRYSLIGRPMLYLGFTPKYIFKELNCNESDSLYISGFYIKKECTLSVFDFRYNLSFLIENDSDFFIDKMDKTDSVDDSKFEMEILLSIASSICSFKKNGEFFSEEYVLPQIVSEIICGEGFDGLLYTSSKTEESSITTSFLDANLVLFTKYDNSRTYDSTYEYDNYILNKMFITNPVNILDLKEEKYKNAVDMIKITNFLKEYIIMLPGNLLKESILNASNRNYAKTILEKNIYFFLIYDIFLKYAI